MDIIPVKRPTTAENEDDLLRLQEEFLNAKSVKSSVTLVKLKGDDVNKEDKPAPIVSDIQEKNIDLNKFEFRTPVTHLSGFPTPGGSKFSSQKLKDSTANVLTFDGGPSNDPEPLDSVKQQIHQENITRLSNMSESEILTEQERLLQKLDPKLVEFIRKRQKPEKTEEKKPENPSELPKLGLDEFPVQPTDEFLHMNRPEPEKMAWMSSLPEMSHQEFASARFDLRGNLMPRIDVPTHLGLHHHGDEPEAPGYTIQELVRLCRSKASNQRILALKILASVVAATKVGIYDDCFRPTSLLQTLLDYDFCTIIRLSMDDNNQSVIVAACKLLASFICNPIDEACLDVSFHWWNGTTLPHLYPKSDEDEEEPDPTAEDETVCKSDVISGFVRMEILERLRYLLEVVRPESPGFIADVFAVFIRIARHSVDTCLNIMNCDRLIDVVMSFVPVVSSFDKPFLYPYYDIPYAGAAKLCRILAATDVQIGAFLAKKYNISAVIANFVVREPHDLQLPLADSCQLIVEIFRLWSQLMLHESCSALFSDLFEVLVKHVQIAVNLNADIGKRQFEWDRATALATVTTKCASMMKTGDFSNQRAVQGIVNVMIIGLSKLLNDAARQTEDADDSFTHMISAFGNTCASIAIGEHCPLDKCSGLNESNVIALGKALADVTPKLLTKMDLASFSAELDDYQIATERDPPSLLSLKSTEIRGKRIFPTVRPRSPFPLITSLCRLFYTFDGKLNVSMVLEHTNVVTYLNQRRNLIDRPKESLFFTRYETGALQWLKKLDNLNTTKDGAHT